MKKNSSFYYPVILMVLGIFFMGSANVKAQTGISIRNLDRHELHEDLKQTMNHVRKMRRIRLKSRNDLNKERYYPHVKSIRKRAEASRKHVEALKKELAKDERSEKKFNNIIFGYDNILHEEAAMEKELDLPKSDNNRLEKHENAIETKLTELKKLLKDI